MTEINVKERPRSLAQCLQEWEAQGLWLHIVASLSAYLEAALVLDLVANCAADTALAPDLEGLLPLHAAAVHLTLAPPEDAQLQQMALRAAQSLYAAPEPQRNSPKKSKRAPLILESERQMFDGAQARLQQYKPAAPPQNILEALIAVAPTALITRDSAYFTPLVYAIHNPDGACGAMALHAILSLAPETVALPGNKGFYPLHFAALQLMDVSLFRGILELCPTASQMLTKQNAFPLHFAAMRPQSSPAPCPPAILELLVAANPAALHAEDSQGLSPVEIAIGSHLPTLEYFLAQPHPPLSPLAIFRIHQRQPGIVDAAPRYFLCQGLTSPKAAHGWVNVCAVILQRGNALPPTLRKMLEMVFEEETAQLLGREPRDHFLRTMACFSRPFFWESARIRSLLLRSAVRCGISLEDILQACPRIAEEVLRLLAPDLLDTFYKSRAPGPLLRPSPRHRLAWLSGERSLVGVTQWAFSW